MGARVDIKNAIHVYVGEVAMEVPASLLPQIEEEAYKRFNVLVQTILTEVREHAQKTPPAFKNSKTVTTLVTSTGYYSQLIDMLKDVFEQDHKFIFRSQNVSPSPTPKDSLLDGMERPIVRRAHSIELIWLQGNRSVYGDAALEVACTYSPQEHLKAEWQAACNALGTDITFKQTDGQASQELHAHRAKLIIHSEFFRGQLNRGDDAFKDTIEPVIVLEHCSIETFKRLLEFIYLGEIPQDIQSNWEALKDLYIAADFYQVKGAKDLCLKGIHTLIKQKKAGEDMAALFDFALTTGDEKLLQICFSHFQSSPAMKKMLIARVDDKNWDKLFQTAQRFASVKETLLQCAEYNPKLEHVLSGNAAQADSKAEKDGGSSSRAPLNNLSSLEV